MARKEAEASKKQKKADKEDAASGSHSSKATKRPRGQGGSFRGGFGSQSGGFGTQSTGMWPYYIPQQYPFSQMTAQPISQGAMAPFFQSYQGYAGHAVRQPVFTPAAEAAAPPPPPPPPPATSAGQPGAQGGRRFACYICGDPSHAMKSCPNRLPK